MSPATYSYWVRAEGVWGQSGWSNVESVLIGFGFFGISVTWTLYNAYVPIYLQAGSPTFDAPGEVGFGLGVGLTRGTSMERAVTLIGSYRPLCAAF